MINYIKILIWWYFKINQNEFHHSLDMFEIPDPIALTQMRNLAHILDECHNIICVIQVINKIGIDNFKHVIKYM